MPCHLRGQLPNVVCGLVGFMDKGTTIVLGGKLPMPHQMCGRLHMIVLQVDTLPNCGLVANHCQCVGYTHTTDQLQAKIKQLFKLVDMCKFRRHSTMYPLAPPLPIA